MLNHIENAVQIARAQMDEEIRYYDRILESNRDKLQKPITRLFSGKEIRRVIETHEGPRNQLQSHKQALDSITDINFLPGLESWRMRATIGLRDITIERTRTNGRIKQVVEVDGEEVKNEEGWRIHSYFAFAIGAIQKEVSPELVLR